MLGNFYAWPTVHHTLYCCTLQGFWISRNFVVDKSRIETRLNGGSFSVANRIMSAEPLKKASKLLSYWIFSLYSPNTVHFSQKLCCIGSAAGNTNNSTGTNPVPNRMAPRQLPGIYIILCLVNNKRYYGQSQNVSARLSQHKSRLRRNLHEVLELQREFNIYGEENFQFSPIWLDKNSTKEQRLALETEFIARFYNLCYNKFDKPNSKGENNSFWRHSHSAETIEQISRSQRENSQNKMPEGFAVNVKGVIYPSISEASRQTKHSRDTLRRWLNDPNNIDCVAVDANQPRGNNNNNTGSLNSVDPLGANTGIAKKISLYGEIYDSINDASRKKKCSRAMIQGLLRNHTDQCFLLGQSPKQNIKKD
jgi:hypothetical protein